MSVIYGGMMYLENSRSTTQMPTHLNGLMHLLPLPAFLVILVFQELVIQALMASRDTQDLVAIQVEPEVTELLVTVGIQVEQEQMAHLVTQDFQVIPVLE